MFKRHSGEHHRQHDTLALERAVAAYWAPLVAYATRLLGDAAAAEDVVQRGFVRLWERQHALPPESELRPFLYHMVRNLVANEWRRTRGLAHWTEAEALDAPAPQAGPDRALEAMELEAAFDAAVERLPVRRREIFVLSRYHGLGNSEIASMLGLSPQTVANTLVTALRDLRQLLAVHLDGRAFPPLKLANGRATHRG